jgi:hypothetical protein
MSARNALDGKMNLAHSRIAVARLYSALPALLHAHFDVLDCLLRCSGRGA